MDGVNRGRRVRSKDNTYKKNRQRPGYVSNKPRCTPYYEKCVGDFSGFCAPPKHSAPELHHPHAPTPWERISSGNDSDAVEAFPVYEDRHCSDSKGECPMQHGGIAHLAVSFIEHLETQPSWAAADREMKWPNRCGGKGHEKDLKLLPSTGNRLHGGNGGGGRRTIFIGRHDSPLDLSKTRTGERHIMSLSSFHCFG